MSAPRQYQRWIASLHARDLRAVGPALRRLEIPTLIVWGTGDVFFNRRWAHWLQATIPGATEIVEVPGGRLFFPDERADELVTALQGMTPISLTPTRAPRGPHGHSAAAEGGRSTVEQHRAAPSLGGDRLSLGGGPAREQGSAGRGSAGGARPRRRGPHRSRLCEAPEQRVADRRAAREREQMAVVPASPPSPARDVASGDGHRRHGERHRHDHDRPAHQRGEQVPGQHQHREERERRTSATPATPPGARSRRSWAAGAPSRPQRDGHEDHDGRRVATSSGAGVRWSGLSRSARCRQTDADEVEEPGHDEARPREVGHCAEAREGDPGQRDRTSSSTPPSLTSWTSVYVPLTPSSRTPQAGPRPP